MRLTAARLRFEDGLSESESGELKRHEAALREYLILLRQRDAASFGVSLEEMETTLDKLTELTEPIERLRAKQRVCGECENADNLRC
jgi:hypothetical protein